MHHKLVYIQDNNVLIVINISLESAEAATPSGDESNCLEGPL